MTWDHIPAREARMMHDVWAMEDARNSGVAPEKTTVSPLVWARDRLVYAMYKDLDDALMREMREADEKAARIRERGFVPPGVQE